MSVEKAALLFIIRFSMIGHAVYFEDSTQTGSGLFTRLYNEQCIMVEIRKLFMDLGRCRFAGRIIDKDRSCKL